MTYCVTTILDGSGPHASSTCHHTSIRFASPARALADQVAWPHAPNTPPLPSPTALPQVWKIISPLLDEEILSKTFFLPPTIKNAEGAIAWVDAKPLPDPWQLAQYKHT